MNLPTRIEQIVCTATYDESPDLSYLEQFDINDRDPGLRKYARLDRLRLRAYQRGDWHGLGLAAKARLRSPAGPTWIDRGGLWGIESDSDPAYFDEVCDDELSELRMTLLAMGATTSETDNVPITYDDTPRCSAPGSATPAASSPGSWPSLTPGDPSHRAVAAAPAGECAPAVSPALAGGHWIRATPIQKSRSPK